MERGQRHAANLFADVNFPSTYTEYSGFADLTVHFTNRFDVQFGGRESYNRQVYNETDKGLFALFQFGADPTIAPTERTNDNSFTYLVTPRFRLSSDLMLYAKVASGLSARGHRTPMQISSILPVHYGPDKTTNYELGLKGETPDHKFSFDGSVYYTRLGRTSTDSWTDQTSGTLYFANGSGAKSEGVELAGQARPIEGLTIAAWVAWNDAKLTSRSTQHERCDWLVGRSAVAPLSSRCSGNLSIEEAFPLAGSVDGFARAAGELRGVTARAFSQTSNQPRLSLPSYMQTNLFAGLRSGSWTATIFATNVTDKRGILSTGYDGYGVPPTTSLATVYIQPRTVGGSLVWTF